MLTPVTHSNDIRPSLTLGQSQSLAITPTIRLGLQILQASRLELRRLIDTELAENPTLEEEPPPDFYRFGTSEPWNASSDEPSREIPDERISLADHLLAQLRLLDISPTERALTAAIIENLDESGYLEATDRELMEFAGVDAAELARGMEIMRTLEPSGVGARGPVESLILQLENAGWADSLAVRILRNRMDLLQAGKVSEIAELEGVKPGAVVAALDEIRLLDPAPGRRIAIDTTEVAIPDVIAQFVDGKFVAVLNENGNPRLKVSAYYREVASTLVTPEEKAYLAAKLASAKRIVRCVHQRQRTLKRVAQCILDLQEDYLRDGMEGLKPLHLTDIAQRVGVHESTVSRAISRKTLLTPNGIVEFKYFFASRLASSSGDVSSHQVKDMIRALIEKEDKAKPHSDYRLADILELSNIKIARRTVTKYREQLGIPAAPLRRIMGSGSSGRG